MLEYLNEIFYDNCDMYNTVTNITDYCGKDMNIAEEYCYSECITSLIVASQTCKYLFIRAGLYDGLSDIIKTCSNTYLNTYSK